MGQMRSLVRGSSPPSADSEVVFSGPVEAVPDERSHRDAAISNESVLEIDFDRPVLRVRALRA